MTIKELSAKLVAEPGRDTVIAFVNACRMQGLTHCKRLDTIRVAGGDIVAATAWVIKVSGDPGGALERQCRRRRKEIDRDREYRRWLHCKNTGENK